MATFSYADAVKLLGAKESKILNALDNTLGGALLSGSVFGALELLGWFDAKADFIRMSKELVAKASEKRLGMSRSDRTDRLHAAHSVIVLVAFFEAFDEAGIPFTTKDLDLTRQRQRDLLENAGETLTLSAPLLTPDQPYERFLDTLSVWYSGLSGRLTSLFVGLMVWVDLDETEQSRVVVNMQRLHLTAVRRYEELLRQLAIDSPEVGLWTMRLDAQATRAEIRTVGVSLTRLEQTLTDLVVGDVPSEQRTELARKYRSALGHPILESRDTSEKLTIPSLKDSYIDPFFQVTGSENVPYAQKSWWTTSRSGWTPTGSSPAT